MFDDTNGTHDWSEEEGECPVGDYGENKHKHFYRCKRCGIRRYGAYAEHVNYHYLLYDHDGGKIEEFLPPCNGRAGKGAVAGKVIVCANCRRILQEGDTFCRRGCNKGAISLSACFMPRA